MEAEACENAQRFDDMMLICHQAKKLGDEAFKNKEFAKAIEHYTESIKENPRNGSQAKHVLLSNRSAAYAASKNWDKALEDALACIQAKPDFSKGWSRKGAALVGQGQLYLEVEN